MLRWLESCETLVPYSTSVSTIHHSHTHTFAETSNPQSLMHLETDCALGPTTCPHNTDLTSGGSSGGEGALLAMKGSALGIGTDIGGSIRSVSEVPQL